jgi:DNA helicase HerA-like ATPase
LNAGNFRMSEKLSFYEIGSFPDLSLPKYGEYRATANQNEFASLIWRWTESEFGSLLGSSFTLRYLVDPEVASGTSRLQIFAIFSSTAVSQNINSLLRDAEGFNFIQTNSRQATPKPEDLEHIAILSRKLDYFEFQDEQFVSPRPVQEGYAETDSTRLDVIFSGFRDPVALDVRFLPWDIKPSLLALRGMASRLEAITKENGPNLIRDYLANVQEVIEELRDREGAEFYISAVSRDAEAARSAVKAIATNFLGNGAFRVSSFSKSDTSYETHVGSFVCAARPADRDRDWYDSDLEDVVKQSKIASPTQRVEDLAALSRVKFVLGRDPFRRALTLPVPSTGSLRTFPLETQIELKAIPLVQETRPSELFLGKNREVDVAAWLPTSDLGRHAFVTGVTGSGKTVTMANLLSQLASQNIPFLVLEPAKQEYRSLVGLPELREKLRIFTPGRDDLSPIRLNPFEVPIGAPLAQHIGGLTAAFDSAFSFGAAMTGIIEAAIWRSYGDLGWKEDDLGGVAKGIPTLEGLQTNLLQTLDSLGYDPEVNSRFSGAMKNRFTRLTRGSIGRIFSSGVNLPSIDSLLSSYTVIELGQLQPHEANLLSLFFLTSLREHLQFTLQVRNKLRLVLVIEEAHNLVPAIDDVIGNDDSSSSKSETSRYVSNMLAELRALGLGIIVVDQTPSAVSKQVIRNTNLKIVHRTVAKRDRETLADAMLMNPAQAASLGRLQVGWAYFYADRVYRPELIQVPMKADETTRGGRKISSNDMLSDNALMSELRIKPWFKTITRIRVATAQQDLNSLVEEVQRFCSDLDDVSATSVRRIISEAESSLWKIESRLVELRALKRLSDEPQDLSSWQNIYTSIQRDLEGVISELRISYPE